MIEAGFAQLRYAASVAFGRRFSLSSLDRLISAIKDTQAEFGGLGSESAELLGGPALDDETRREMQLSRFKKQARIAALETPYYRQLFQETGLNPAQLTQAGLLDIPLT